MIARTWHGTTRAADADTYLDYLHRTGLAAFQATAGNQGAAVLRRVTDERAEFIVVSLWDSIEAVRRFAGADETRARFFPEDDRYLVTRDGHVDHFEVVYTSAAPAGAVPG
jgi:heme-degrading monooxygenase HmoA